MFLVYRNALNTQKYKFDKDDKKLKSKLSDGNYKNYHKECKDAKNVINLIRNEYLERNIRYPEMKRRFRIIMGLPESAEI